MPGAKQNQGINIHNPNLNFITIVLKYPIWSIWWLLLSTTLFKTSNQFHRKVNQLFNPLLPSDCDSIRWYSSGGTKPLLEPMLTYHQESPGTSFWGQFHKHQSQKVTGNLLIRCYSYLQGANELTHYHCPLRPRDTIWWHRFGSSLAQVMACCLTATSHYLNQCCISLQRASLLLL